MKANELRIGNFVFDDENKPMKVARVETQECTDFNGNDEFNVIIEHIDKNIGYYESKINPIPLTEEWLLMFGFKNDGNGYYKHKKLFSPITKISDYAFSPPTSVYFLRVGDDKDEPVLKYVHQLQNLYFALTNEELIYTP